RAFLEVGPGQTLTTLLRQQLGRGGSHAVIASLPTAGDEGTDTQSMLMAAGRLWMAGAELDWSGIHGHARRRRVRLPTYPFERKRYWVDPVPPAAGEAGLPLTPTPEVAALDMSASGTVTHDEDGNMDQPMVFEAETAHGRKADLTARLQALFSELSGLAESELDTTVSFLELGLDSLFLTQASTAIHKAFGVKVAFRELLEEAATL